MSWDKSKILALRMGSIILLTQDTKIFTPNMDQLIVMVEDANDLGVIFGFRMSFNGLIQEVKERANNGCLDHQWEQGGHQEPQLELPSSVGPRAPQ